MVQVGSVQMAHVRDLMNSDSLVTERSIIRVLIVYRDGCLTGTQPGQVLLVMDHDYFSGKHYSAFPNLSPSGAVATIRFHQAIRYLPVSNTALMKSKSPSRLAPHG